MHNLTKKFPWDSNSASIIYSSHTLEHLSREDGGRFITECFRALKPGRIVRIVVPDLDVIVEKYSPGGPFFLDELHVSYEQDGDSNFKKVWALLIQYPHKCMYDTKILLRVLSNAGFSAEPCVAFGSIIAHIVELELSGNAVIVEGIK